MMDLRFTPVDPHITEVYQIRGKLEDKEERSEVRYD